MSAPSLEPLKARRAWIALLAPPLLLGVCFAPVVAYLALTRGLSGDDLVKAMEPLAAIPGAFGFTLSFLLARWLAKRDGLSLRDLGWQRPSALDVVLGVIAASLLWALNHTLLYPLIQSVQPSFDPTAAAVSVPAALLLLTIAVLAEDTVYRGYALTVFRRRYGAALAVALTSLCYAFITPGAGWPLMLWAFGFGVVLAGVRMWRGNLWPVVVMHWLVSLGPKLLAQL